MEIASILLPLSIALLAGLLLSRLAKLAQLPAVTAYLVAGILVGPFVLGKLGHTIKLDWLGFTSMDQVKHFDVLSQAALGFIAFSIGNEFRIPQLKKIGKQATIIGIFQAVITTLLVDAILIGLSFLIPDNKFPLESAIVLGAIASATAPAATLMVVKQYKAKGPVTDTLLPVVALDDAVGLVLFAISYVVRQYAEPRIISAQMEVHPLVTLFAMYAGLKLAGITGLIFAPLVAFISKTVYRSYKKQLTIYNLWSKIKKKGFGIPKPFLLFSVGTLTLQFVEYHFTHTHGLGRYLYILIYLDVFQCLFE